MRKLILTEFISVDCIAEVEKLPGVAWNDEMNTFKEDELADSGAMLLGRTTYEIFAGSWPKQTGDFADRFNTLPKNVASTTLKDLDWKPAELLKGPLPEAVAKLKQTSGGNIYVHGQSQRRLAVAKPRPRRPLQTAQLPRRRRPGQTAVRGRCAGCTGADLGQAVQQWRGGVGVCASSSERLTSNYPHPRKLDGGRDTHASISRLTNPAAWWWMKWPAPGSATVAETLSISRNVPSKALAGT